MQAQSYGRLVLGLGAACPLPAFAERLVPSVSRLLSSANIFLPPRAYARFTVALLLLPAPLQAMALWLPLPQAAMLASSLALVQLTPLLVPVTRARSRARATDLELPFFLMALTVFARGAPPSLGDAFDRASELGSRVFPAIVSEDALLKRNLAFSPGSGASVAEATFKDHPSRGLREFVKGFQTTAETGRDIIEFVEGETKRYVELLGESWKSFVDSAGSLSEVSFLLLALFPVGLDMIAAAVPGFASSEMLLSFLLLLTLFAVLLMAVIDSIQPRLYDDSPGLSGLALVCCLWVLGMALYLERVVSFPVALLAPILASSVSVSRSRTCHLMVRRGQDEVALLLHQLAEQSKAGVSLPEALSRLTAGSTGFSSIRMPLASFQQSLQLGASPPEAQKTIAHQSWLVRLAFGMLSIAFGTGAGFEQLERLSIFFKRVSDSRRSVGRSLLPFLAIGAAVPCISAASLVLLEGFVQSGASFLPQFSQASQGDILLSISAASLLTGLMLSKLYAQTVRFVVAVPLLLLSTLVSVLVLGLA